MKQLLHLLKFDFLLMARHKIITISVVVTAIYIGVFKALAAMGSIESFLILVIFNDPALLGFLFIGVMVLFEKNEHTLEALSVTPIRSSNYLLSKSLVLSLLSLACCFAMVLGGYGFHFHWLHFTAATLCTTFIFSMLGCMAVAGQSSFNKFIIRALGILLVLVLPFLGYFEVVPSLWFVLFPTKPAIDLYQLAFATHASGVDVLITYTLCIIWALVTYLLAKRAVATRIFT